MSGKCPLLALILKSESLNICFNLVWKAISCETVYLVLHWLKYKKGLNISFNLEADVILSCCVFNRDKVNDSIDPISNRNKVYRLETTVKYITYIGTYIV